MKKCPSALRTYALALRFLTYKKTHERAPLTPMGNCFSSCFPSEDPETIALREENERRELQQARANAAAAAEAREKKFASSSLGKALKKSELKAKRERESAEIGNKRAEQNAKDWLS